MKFRLIALTALVILHSGIGNAVRADTDQRCLGDCTTARGSASRCLEQCSYNLKSPSAQSWMSAPIISDPHNVFAPPQPSDKSMILKPAQANPPPPSPDRTCLKDCLAFGYRYGLCNEQCIPKPCAPTAVMCTKSARPMFPPFQVKPSAKKS